MGAGAYGHVWRVKEKRSGKYFALKKIFEAFRHSTDAKRTYREIAVLRQLSHRNVLRLECVERASNDSDLYLVCQLMECDLHYLVTQGRLHARHRKYLVYQLLLGLKYIHSASLLHRDLKPSNLLVNSACLLKIADFGLVRTLEADNEDELLTQEVATRWYRAPEVLLGSRSYSFPADLWSVGCIVGELLLGRPLFQGDSTRGQLQKILTLLELPSGQDIQSLAVPDLHILFAQFKHSRPRPAAQWFSRVEPDGADLVLKLLAFNPAKRLTVDQALRHNYLAEFRGTEEEKIFQGKIELKAPENRKLPVRVYRQLIYEEVASYYRRERAQSNPLRVSFQRSASQPGQRRPHTPSSPAAQVLPSKNYSAIYRQMGKLLRRRKPSPRRKERKMSKALAAFLSAY